MERTDLEFWTPHQVAKLLTLLENEKRYFQEILASVPVGLAIVAADLSLVSVNRAFRKQFDLAHEDVARVTLSELIAEEAVLSRVAQCRESRQATEPVFFRRSLPSRPDQNLRLQAFPFADWFSQEESDVLVVVEQAEGLPPSVQSMVRALPGVVWRTDESLKEFEFANPDTLTRISSLQPEQWRQRILEADAGRVARVYQTVFSASVGSTSSNRGTEDGTEKGGMSGVVDYRLDRGNQDWVWLADEVQRVEGDPPVLQVFTSDVTSRRHDTRRALDTAKIDALSRFAGKLAHDFNNILMVLQLNLEEALQGLPDGDARKESLSEALQATERFASINQQLALLGKQPLTASRLINLNDWLTQMSFPASLSLSPTPATVEVDPSILERAVRELLTTTDESPYIHLERAHVMVDFASGMGAGEYVLLRLGPLQKVTDELEDRWNEPFHGLGNGVATACATLRRAGAHVYLRRFRSNAAEYEICFPLAQPPAQPEAAAAQQTEAVLPSRETILVLEDEASIRSLVARVLRREGYQVLEASSGQEALQILSQHAGEPALIVSDVMLPDMLGTELVAQLRLIHKRMPVVYMSGYSDERALSSGKLAPYEAFLAKPFSLSVLLQTVRLLLSQSRG
ncbi:MAG: response regulator [Bryobacteraceae bacterium]|nr:response regulator [Bryobacteraceae bacterium]MDW8379077.1 response regulator [Bryobacterales bacterium]